MYDKIEAFYKENYRHKVNIVSRILRGDRAGAEDVVQEAFCRALKFNKSYIASRGTLDKWFNSIMFNYLHEHQRASRAAYTEDTDNLSVEDIFQEMYKASDPSSRAMLLKHIHKVDNEDHRRVLKLFLIYGYTSKDIAQIEQKITQNNVTTIVSRFRSEVVGD